MPNNDCILRSDALSALSRGSGCENICSNAIKRIPSADVEPKRRWIPVTERLPKVGEDVLVFAVEKSNDFPSVIAISDRMIFRLFPSSEGVETWRPPWQYFMTDYEITHWMPLPEPPKKEKED